MQAQLVQHERVAVEREERDAMLHQQLASLKEALRSMSAEREVGGGGEDRRRGPGGEAGGLWGGRRMV